MWPHRITASPSDSQSEGRGSIPRGATRLYRRCVRGRPRGPLFFAEHRHRRTKLVGGCAESRKNFRVHFSQIQLASDIYENIKEKPGHSAGFNFKLYLLSQNFCPRRDRPSGLEEFFNCWCGELSDRFQSSFLMLSTFRSNAFGRRHLQHVPPTRRRLVSTS